MQAAVISGLGLSVFAISTFTPTQRFGVLMLVILWLGAVAELIYFPALLAGPLGSVFKPRKKAAAGHTFEWRSHEISRIEGLCDAVFAFAVTLLVVSLEVPRTFAELTEALHGFIPFAIGPSPIPRGP